jgi:hypothetical protein
VPAEHDGELGAGHRVLAFGGRRVEDDAEGTFGILLKGNGLWDQIAEALVGVELGGGVVEVNGLYGYIGGEGGVAEGGNDEVEVLGAGSGLGLGVRLVGGWS